MELNALLQRVVAAGASDVHLKLGQPPIVRIDGDLEPLSDAPVLGEAELEAALHAVTVRSPKRRESFYETGDLGPNETIAFRRVSLAAAAPIYPPR